MLLNSVGELMIISSRRILNHRMSEEEDKVFGYLFTDPEAVVYPEFALPAVPGSLGGKKIIPMQNLWKASWYYLVTHTSEISYVFGNLVSNDPSSAARDLSNIIQDYWISFSASLNPNDGHDAKRKFSVYMHRQLSVIVLSSNTITQPQIGPNWQAYTPANQVSYPGWSLLPYSFLFNVSNDRL